jgi:transposase
MPWTEEELARAKVMLDDGMSYKMVVEELDRSPHAAQSLAKHFPGKGWTSSQTQEYRWMKHRLENL